MADVDQFIGAVDKHFSDRTTSRSNDAKLKLVDEFNKLSEADMLKACKALEGRPALTPSPATAECHYSKDGEFMDMKLKATFRSPSNSEADFYATNKQFEQRIYDSVLNKRNP